MIGELLGHTQVQTTARYAHLANDPVKSAANRIANRIADVRACSRCQLKLSRSDRRHSLQPYPFQDIVEALQEARSRRDHVEFMVNQLQSDGAGRASLSTLADQVGACAVALRPLHDLIAEHVLSADRLHGDDTPVPVLAKILGRTQAQTNTRYDHLADDPLQRVSERVASSLKKRMGGQVRRVWKTYEIPACGESKVLGVDCVRLVHTTS